MSLYKRVKCEKFDIDKNQNAQNITEFLATKGITAGRLLKVETVYRHDDLQTILVFYTDGELDALPIPRGEKGDIGDPGQQGPKGEPGENGTGCECDIPAVCVFWYRSVRDPVCDCCN